MKAYSLEITKIKLNEVGSDVGLYVITFNSPKQLETLIESMLEYDPSFITKTKKFLLHSYQTPDPIA